MFKVVREDKDYDEWDIVHIDSDKVVACIQIKSMFRGSYKQLKVKDKVVDNVKNQAEALVKLEEFFGNLKSEIGENKALIKLLKSDMNLVEDSYTKTIIDKEIKRINTVIEGLEKYNLI